jgi:elongation factor 2
MSTADRGRFLAFGRIFSGTVTKGQKVRILAPDFKADTSKGVYEKSIQRIYLMIGCNIE